MKNKQEQFQMESGDVREMGGIKYSYVSGEDRIDGCAIWRSVESAVKYGEVRMIGGVLHHAQVCWKHKKSAWSSPVFDCYWYPVK